MMKKIITLIMCLICCYSYAFIIDGDGGSGWIAEPTSIIISGGGGSSSGGWEEYDPAKTYYTVTLLDNDRTTILASKLVEEGSDVTIDFTPVKIGHVFTTWTDDNNVPVTQITNISADTRLFAMWDNGRYSITYYVDGEYQGIQFYDENDTITPLAAPAPYDAAVDSCFVGWYNIPQNFKMPAHNIIATATIDNDCSIDFVWNFGGSTNEQIKAISAIKGTYDGLFKIPPVHNSRIVNYLIFSISFQTSAAIASFAATDIGLPTELYFNSDYPIDYFTIQTSGTPVFSNVASVTLVMPNISNVSNRFSIYGIGQNVTYLDIGKVGVTKLGRQSGATVVGDMPSNGINATMEKMILPETLQTWFAPVNGEFKGGIRDTLYLPATDTLTINSYYSNAYPYPLFLNANAVETHIVVASQTRLLFHGVTYNSSKIVYPFSNSTVRVTFEGGYLPTYTPNFHFAVNSRITIEYHSSRGEWQDPSFKEDTVLWGNLNQYTWVDLDAEPAPIEPIVTATYIDGLDASHTVSIATGTDNSINLGLDYVYEIKAKYTGANITALDTTTRWTSSDITVLSEELIDNETVCARIKLSDAYFANADQPHAQTLSFDNSGITSESPLATFSFSIIPQNFYSYDASGLGFAVAKYNNQTPMSMPVVANTLTLSSYQDRAYVVFTLDTRPDKSNSNLPTIVFGNPLVQSLEQLGHFAGTREEWEDIWSKFTLYWGNTAGATTKSYRANDFVVYRRIMGYENMECLPPMFNIDFEGIGAYSGYYTIFYTGSVLKKDVLKHLRTGNEYVLAYYNADTPISAQPAISIHLY